MNDPRCENREIAVLSVGYRNLHKLDSWVFWDFIFTVKCDKIADISLEVRLPTLIFFPFVKNDKVGKRQIYIVLPH